MLRRMVLLLPAVRRLHEARNAVMAERDDLAAQREVLLVQRDTLLAERDAMLADVAEIRSARAQHRVIVTEYGYHPRRRPIEEAAGGLKLIARLRAEEDRYAAVLQAVMRHTDALAGIPFSETDPERPFWSNDWFPPWDGATLYGLIAERAPQRFIEVGSGNSTRFARQAIRDFRLRTRIVSVDPHPHTSIAGLCDETLPSRMEDVPTDFWEGIGPDDMLFLDNSHRSFQNSDVTVFFSEVLPALRSGTVWGLHDIFLPMDYPDYWKDRFYNEQYLLLAYLLGGGGEDDILLPVAWSSSNPRLRGIMEPLWAHDDELQGWWAHGGCFWMQRR